MGRVEAQADLLVGGGSDSNDDRAGKDSPRGLAPGSGGSQSPWGGRPCPSRSVHDSQCVAVEVERVDKDFQFENGGMAAPGAPTPHLEQADEPAQEKEMVGCAGGQEVARCT